MARCLCLGLLALAAVDAVASVPAPSIGVHHRLSQSEPQLWTIPARIAVFGRVPHVSAALSCEDIQPPEALTTPNPLLVPALANQKVKVSFIIGADGRVHNPLILESGGTTGDRNILRTVKTWRYRPATCNGVPTEAEGKIEFSHR
jgi:TonB family protein